MEAIDKLLYNLLSSGTSVVLPEVGTLCVEQKPTTLSGKEVTYASRRVRFSSRADKSVRTLVEVMTQEYGLTAELASEAYGEWLRIARSGSELNIEGVGKVSKGFFKPTEEFEREALNPWQPAPVTLHRRRSPLPFIVVALLAAGAAGAWWWFESAEQRAEEVVAEIAEEVESDMTEETIVASLEEYAEELDVVAEAAAEEPQEAAKKDVKAVATERYVVVGGVFSTNENADKFIAEDALGIGRAAYTKHSYAGGKILVGVGVFETPEEANVRRRELSTANNTLWVHKY